MSWQKGLLPFPTHTRNILSSSPLQFPEWGHCSLLAVWEGEELLVWLGMEGAVESFVCCVGFATIMGQVPRVVPRYLELSFFKWGEKEKNGALPQGKLLSQRCAALGSCILLVFTLIR